MAAGFVVASIPVAKRFFDNVGQADIFSHITSSFRFLTSKSVVLREQGASGTSSGRPRGSYSVKYMPRRVWQRAYGMDETLGFSDAGSFRALQTSISLEEGTNRQAELYSSNEARVPHEVSYST